MSGRKYTVLVIPEGSHRVRRFRIRRSLIRSAVVFCMLVGIGLAALVSDYLNINVDRGELHRLQSQNKIQQKQLQSLAVNLEDLRKEMVVLTQNDAKVRILAKLSKPKNEALNGIGGPLEEDVPSDFSELQRQIDELRQEIDLHRQSQEEIQGFLNDQRSLLAAKPQGWPTKGWITSNFGVRKSPFSGKRKMHEGLDIAARTGTDVYACADGIVSRAETAPGYGKLVVIDHGYGYKTYYGHNSKIYVKVGQRVKRGERISAVGNTGVSTGPHCHYEVRLNNVPLNPRKFL